jgi:energy-coupling factor transport system substrate-specific component
VTWQIASFAVLFAALAAGFGWYERTHPSAKVLALVATLAALAALGRMAFAPLPNIKPTIVIILISGYVLGAAPGFAVGAVSALASNFFFGQGPYTPWQMVGFGAAGLVGAGLARIAGRDLGRWPLAAACGAAGFALGTFLDFSLWVTYGSHSLAELVLLAGRGLPFNLALVVGNVVFCLAFGPMLVRALGRFRDRFEITWHPAPAAATTAAALLVAIVLVGAAAPAADAADGSVQRAVSYLRSAQTADGGFGDRAGANASNEMHTAWAAMGLAAAGTRPSAATAAYLRRQRGRVRDVGDIERTILGLRAAGQDAGPLVAKLQRRRRANGSYEQLVNRSAFAVLAQRAAGRRADPKTVRWLLSQQNTDGGWSLGGKGGESGVDDTAGRRAGAGQRGTALEQRGAPRDALARAPPGPRRRLPADAGRAVQRPVDGVRRPGPRRGRAQRRARAPQRQPLAGRLPALPAEPGRQHPLLAHQPAGPDLGDRSGARRAGGQGAARPRAACRSPRRERSPQRPGAVDDGTEGRRRGRARRGAAQGPPPRQGEGSAAPEGRGRPGPRRGARSAGACRRSAQRARPHRDRRLTFARFPRRCRSESPGRPPRTSGASPSSRRSSRSSQRATSA